MKIWISYTVYWEGPNSLKKIIESWPYNCLPKIGEILFFDTKDGELDVYATVENVYWLFEDEGLTVQILLKSYIPPYGQPELQEREAKGEIELWKSAGFELQ